MDINRLAEAHYIVQRNNAINRRQVLINSGLPYGAVDEYIINTPWSNLEEGLKAIRRATAQALAEAYDGIT